MEVTDRSQQTRHDEAASPPGQLRNFSNFASNVSWLRGWIPKMVTKFSCKYIKYMQISSLQTSSTVRGEIIITQFHCLQVFVYLCLIASNWMFSLTILSNTSKTFGKVARVANICKIKARSAWPVPFLSTKHTSCKCISLSTGQNTYNITTQHHSSHSHAESVLSQTSL